MPSAQSSPDEDRTGKGDRLSTLNRLEGQRREAGDIVYRWFRFRVRRGLGIFYCLLSFLPVLGTILGTLGASQDVVIVGTSVGLVCAWIVSRSLGLRGFGKMSNTLDLLKGDGSLDGGSARFKGASTVIAIILWPWLAYAIAGSLGLTDLEVLFAVVWLVEFVAYRFLTLRRNKNPIVDHRTEDWLVVFIIPMAALLSTVRIVPNASQFYAFLLISPILLFCGIKSLYDAPKELVRGLDSQQG